MSAEKFVLAVEGVAAREIIGGDVRRRGRPCRPRRDRTNRRDAWPFCSAHGPLVGNGLGDLMGGSAVRPGHLPIGPVPVLGLGRNRPGAGRPIGRGGLPEPRDRRARRADRRRGSRQTAAATTIHNAWPCRRGALVSVDAGETHAVPPRAICRSRCAFFRAWVMMLIRRSGYVVPARASPPKCSRVIRVCGPASPFTGNQLSRWNRLTACTVSGSNCPEGSPQEIPALLQRPLQCSDRLALHALAAASARHGSPPLPSGTGCRTTVAATRTATWALIGPIPDRSAPRPAHPRQHPQFRVGADACGSTSTKQGLEICGNCARRG